MVRALRRRYPEADITLLCRYNLLEIYGKNPDVDHLELFNIESYAADLVRGGGLLHAFRDMKRAVNRLQSMKFDFVVNATHDRFCTFLTHMLSAPRVEGMYLDADDGLKLAINGFWFRYLRCTPAFRKNTCFNLVDIYKNAVGGDPQVRNLRFDVSPEAMTDAEELMGHSAECADDVTYIGFQLGTSTGLRRWPVECFAKLGDSLQEHPRTRVVLVGSKNERELGESVESLMIKNPINLIGKTSIPVLAALLQKCKVLVTNDTGTMHLAEAVGTKCVALFLESANPFQTGPYGRGHIVCTPALDCFPCPTNISCDKKRCLDAIPVNLVYQLVSWKFLGGRKDTVMIPEGANVFETRFDGHGLWQFSPLGGLKLNAEDIIRLVYRQVWGQCWVERENGVPREDRNPHGSELNRMKNAASGYTVDRTELENWLHEFVLSIGALEEKVRRGKSLLRELKRDALGGTSDGKAVLEKSVQLEILNEEIVQSGTSPYLTQVASLFYLELAQARDGHFLLVCREWAEVYKNLGFRIGLLREQIDCWRDRMRSHHQRGIGNDFKCCPETIELPT